MAVTERTIWSDLHPDLKIGADGAVSLVTNVEAVYASLENILLTIMGERVMIRNFATNPHSLLFERIDDEHLRTVFAEDFRDAIERWEPRVKVENIDVRSNPERGEVYIKLRAYIIGYEQVFTFDFMYSRSMDNES